MNPFRGGWRPPGAMGSGVDGDLQAPWLPGWMATSGRHGFRGGWRPPGGMASGMDGDLRAPLAHSAAQPPDPISPSGPSEGDLSGRVGVPPAVPGILPGTLRGLNWEKWDETIYGLTASLPNFVLLGEPWRAEGPSGPRQRTSPLPKAAPSCQKGYRGHPNHSFAPPPPSPKVPPTSRSVTAPPPHPRTARTASVAREPSRPPPGTASNARTSGAPSGATSP